jgi:hypothetical protein
MVSAPRDEIWQQVDQLVQRAPSLRALRAHGMHLIAARAWRAAGRPVPDELHEDELDCAMLAMAAPLLLDRARSAYDGRLVLMKGPEAAARYPDPSVRRFRDLDLLVDRPQDAQRALVAAGFVELGDSADYEGRQHLCPLAWPGLPLLVELHREPNRPPWLAARSVEELMALTAPSAAGVDGVLAPVPEAHALLLSGHAWAHHPLGRLIDLIDVAAVLSEGDREAAGELARAWGWEGMWRVTLGVIDGLLADERRPLSLATWARHLAPIRDRSVLENHLSRVAAPACALPLRDVPQAIGASFLRTARRRGNERWIDKLHRSRLAVAHAFMDTSKHEQTLTTETRRT